MFFLRRKWTVITLIILIPVGLLTKSYSGPASLWVNYSLGGILYVIFWSLFFSVLLPKTKPLKIALSVFIITCILECFQLWHPSFLESIREHFLGRALLGTSFSWLDMLHYLIGFFISFILLTGFHRIEMESPNEN